MVRRDAADAQHSPLDRPEQVNANWSSGLTLWDRLHGTLRLDVPSSDVVIGIRAYRTPEEVSLTRIVSLPLSASADVVI